MSYLRGEYYIHPDARGGVQFNCGKRGMLWLPTKVFDALVMMRWAEMTEKERQQANRDALELGSGNVGCVPLEKMAKTVKENKDVAE